MNRILAILIAATTSLHGVDLTLSTPLDYQVVQRSSPGKGLLRIAGEFGEGPEDHRYV